MTPTLRSFLCALCVAGLLVAAGCTPAIPPAAIDTEPLRPLTRLSADQPFAANDQGSSLAFADHGLHLMPLPDGAAALLDRRRPLALAWSPDGERLAAVFDKEPATLQLVLYTRDGEPVDSRQLPLRLSTLRWSRRGDLLLAGYTLTTYRFGSNLTQTLHLLTVDGGNETRTLADTTLKPSTARRYAEHLDTLLQVEFSVAGDELVFTRLHDPPEFPPYLQLGLRNWQVERHRVLAQLPVMPTRLRFVPSREQVRVMAASGDIALIPLWQDEQGGAPRFSADSAPAAVSPTGRYRLQEGALFDEERLLVQWPSASRIQFLSGGRFLLADGHRLYLGDGLQGEALPVYREHDWTLRRWLHEGLIAPVDYRRLDKDLNP
ncbi:MAG: hypothetical protein RQ723_07600 [Desulfuromonadales bacterium]|nr:hypothetical protein [Desulfuromonadales bacterium]